MLARLVLGSSGRRLISSFDIRQLREASYYVCCQAVHEGIFKADHFGGQDGGGTSGKRNYNSGKPYGLGDWNSRDKATMVF